MAGFPFPEQIHGLLRMLGGQRTAAKRILYGSNFPYTVAEMVHGLCDDMDSDLRVPDQGVVEQELRDGAGLVEGELDHGPGDGVERLHGEHAVAAAVSQHVAGRRVDEHGCVMPVQLSEDRVQARVAERHAVGLRQDGEPYSAKVQGVADLLDGLLDAGQRQRGEEAELIRESRVDLGQLVVGRLKVRAGGRDAEDGYRDVVVPHQLDVILNAPFLRSLVWPYSQTVHE